jgi:lipid II:glycine glycyltransferase (peptidoglycan interpeptide bridge formation enzyme)
MDLTLPLDVQRSRYRKNHKHGINRLRRLGVTCSCDKAYLGEFIEIYYETMRRVRASDSYFFEHVYFEQLISTLDSQMQLFACLLEGNVICAGLFGLCGSIVQYHLGGTRDAFLELAPMKLLFDTVRVWANERGAHAFHLGGGTDAREDSLFHFKAGFSDQIHEFAIWRWVLRPDIYDRLSNEKTYWNQHTGLQPASTRLLNTFRPIAVQLCRRQRSS